jgi:hypothetical protein
MRWWIFDFETDYKLMSVISYSVYICGWYHCVTSVSDVHVC